MMLGQLALHFQKKCHLVLHRVHRDMGSLDKERRAETAATAGPVAWVGHEVTLQDEV